MGANQFGAPLEEIAFLRNEHSTRVFVETGTFKGATAERAASMFDRVFTIEGSPAYYEEASTKLARFPNVECLLGDSRLALKEVLDRMGKVATLFWLDAHWMPGSFGEAAECPVLEEIQIILHNADDCIILVDDARLFLAPPPRPHKADNWPSMDAVLQALNSEGAAPRYNLTHGDVIFSVPLRLKKATTNFFQSMTTAEMNRPHPSLTQKLWDRFVRG